jgi:hypothetical protein
MGGNRYHRKYYTEKQIEDLVEKYFDLGESYLSLFTEKNKDSYKLWVNDLSRFMDTDSKKRLLHEINKRKNQVSGCISCGTEMQYHTLVKTLFSMNTYKPWCDVCVGLQVWKKTENIDYQKLILRGERISSAKLKFYQTDYGKEVAKAIGNKNSSNMKRFNKTDAGKKNIEKSRQNNRNLMLQKIADGFVPPINNSFTHWSAIIHTNDGIKKFRSSWEACIWCCNQHLNYETKRIPYTDEQNIKRHYIADFYDPNKNIIYEVKPKCHWMKANHKMQEVIRYCKTNGITFIWINEHNITTFVDEAKFTKENYPQYEKMMKGIKQ